LAGDAFAYAEDEANRFEISALRAAFACGAYLFRLRQALPAAAFIYLEQSNL
jgi:hypothetical protein